MKFMNNKRLYSVWSGFWVREWRQANDTMFQNNNNKKRNVRENYIFPWCDYVAGAAAGNQMQK